MEDLARPSHGSQVFAEQGNSEAVIMPEMPWSEEGCGMRTRITNTGWTEETTKVITITALGKKPLLPVAEWVDFSKRYPRIGKKRKDCERCRRKWTELTGGVNMVYSDKGNKAVCDDCMKELRAQFEEVVDAEM